MEDCRVGDVVRIQECRKVSKQKNFRLMEIVERIDGAGRGQQRTQIADKGESARVN